MTLVQWRSTSNLGKMCGDLFDGMECAASLALKPILLAPNDCSDTSPCRGPRKCDVARLEVVRLRLLSRLRSDGRSSSDGPCTTHPAIAWRKPLVGGQGEALP